MSARAIGMSTGPIERKGCPKASTELPSTQVTVPVAERTMSPESSTAATAEPGSSGLPPVAEGVAVPAAAGAEAPDGATSQPAASATSPKSFPGASEPDSDTGRGSGEGPVDAASALSGLTSAASGSANARSRNAVTNADARVAAPPIGTGGPAGALRMSSMLWIGVIPQIGSREKGQP